MSNFSLTVLIEINGVMTKAGSITGTDYKDAVFSYDDSYTAEKNHRPISISLPLSKKPFSKIKNRSTSTFFHVLCFSFAEERGITYSILFS